MTKTIGYYNIYGNNLYKMIRNLGFIFIIALLLTLAQGQENSTDYRDYEYYYTDPSENPSDPNPTANPSENNPPVDIYTDTTEFPGFSFPATTTPSFEIQTPSTPAIPDITPIVEQVDQSCCAVPSLDCSLVNQQMMMNAASKDEGMGVSFDDAHHPLAAAFTVLRQPVSNRSTTREFVNNSDIAQTDVNSSSSRYRRQVELQEQYIDQLGINLLRFESCLCQANRSPSACRMLFPPGFYTPNRPGLFDVIFNGDLVVKRFRCSFYNGNIVDCLFQAITSYDPLTAPMVYFVINDKAEISGRQCITCNSMYCTFEAFQKRNLGSTVPFNQDYAECVANRSGTPLPKTTTTTPRPFWTGGPLTSSDHVLEDHDEAASALKALSLITRKGILMGLGRHGGQTMLAELYNIGPDLAGGFHPILHHDNDHDHRHRDDHNDGHYAWIIALAVVVGLLAGAIVIFIVIYFMRKRRSKVSVQRSLRGLPIVKLDVLDPSPFCGSGSGADGGGGGGGGLDNEDDYRSGVSEVSRGSESLYGITPGSADSLKYSSGDVAPPVARVVPFPKPTRKPSKQPPLPAPPSAARQARSPINANRRSNTDHVDGGHGGRFRNHSSASSSSSPTNNNNNNRHTRRGTAIIHEDPDDNVFLPRRPEIRERTMGSSNASTRSDASSVHIYTRTKRPKVPPRSPANTLNNRSDNAGSVLHHFTQPNPNALKPQVAPRTPRNIAARRHDSASRTSSNVSTNSGRSLIPQGREQKSSTSQRSDFAPSPVIHRSISKQRSNLPSTSSSRGSRSAQGFYYDVDEEFEDYNDIYASIDEEDGEDDENEIDNDHHKYHDAIDDDDDEVIENLRGKGHGRYETRICPSQEILTDVNLMGNPQDRNQGVGGDQGAQYEVPVRSAAVLNKPPPRVPVKPARMNHLMPPQVMSGVLANSLPSAVAPPVPQRVRAGSSSSSSSSSSMDYNHHPDDYPEEVKYADHGSRLENEYTVIRDDLVQTSGFKYS